MHASCSLNRALSLKKEHAADRVCKDIKFKLLVCVLPVVNSALMHILFIGVVHFFTHLMCTCIYEAATRTDHLHIRTLSSQICEMVVPAHTPLYVPLQEQLLFEQLRPASVRRKLRERVGEIRDFYGSAHDE
jgi:hypothetical protein